METGNEHTIQKLQRNVNVIVLQKYVVLNIQITVSIRVHGVKRNALILCG